MNVLVDDVNVEGAKLRAKSRTATKTVPDGADWCIFVDVTIAGDRSAFSGPSSHAMMLHDLVDDYPIFRGSERFGSYIAYVE